MKIHELIDVLSKMDPELDVVLSQDSEGNGYGKLRCIDDNNVIDKENQIYLHHLTPSLRKKGYSKQDIWNGDANEVKRCVVFWP